MNNVFIHIGLPRSGTTFLQQYIFTSLPEFFLITIPFSNYGEPFQKLQYQDDTLYNHKEVKNELQALFTEKKVLISNENFTGQSLFWFNGNRTRIAQRLQQLFPNAHIILTLRNQLDLLRSMYEINLQWKETKTLDQFIISANEQFSLNDYTTGKTQNLKQVRYPVTESYEHIEGYDYLPLIKLYQSLFPKVHILFYEDFVSNKKFFITQLEEALQTSFSTKIKDVFFNSPKINAGLDAHQAEKLRKLNRLAILAENNKLIAAYYHRKKRAVLQQPSTKEKIDFSAQKKQELTRYFSEKNQKLQQELSIIPEGLKSNYFL